MSQPLTTSSPPAPGAPGGGEVTMPATPLQEALWRIHHRAPDRSVYNLTWRLELGPGLDRVALETAWQAVVDRHQALRTGLHQRGSGIEQRVVKRAAVSVPEIAWDPGDGERLQAQLDTVARELHVQPFELDRPPLARLAVVRAGLCSELHMCAYHGVLDGWALQLVAADLSWAYRAAADGGQVTFEREAVPMSEYCRSLLEARGGPQWEAARRYWRERLAGGGSVALGADPECDATPGAPGGVLQHAFSAEAERGLRALAETAAATPFVGVLGAMFAVLSAAGAGDDITVGVVVANRTTVRAQALVGYLANTVLIRAPVGAGDRLADVTSRVRDELWESLPHQHLQFPEMLAALDEDARTSYGTTLPILITDHGHVGQDLGVGDVRATLRPSPSVTARGSLAMSMFSDGRGRRVEVEFDATRYSRREVLDFLGDVDRTLAAVARGSQAGVGDLAVRVRATGGARTRPTARAPAATAPGAPVAGPDGGGTLLEDVSRVWQQVLGGSPPSPDDDFFALGGTSLLVVQLLEALQDSLGVELDVASWLARPTAGGIVRSLRDRAAGQARGTGGPIVLQEGPGPHLHLVPGAGGSPHDFHALVRALPADWHVTTVRDRGEGSAADLAERWRSDLDAHGRAVDAYGGWSIGGLFAYEMAQAEAAAGRSAALVLLDTDPRGNVPETYVDLLHAYVDGVYLGAGLPHVVPRFSTGQDATPLVLAAVAGLLECTGVTLPAAALEERWRRYRSHSLAVEGYVAARPLATRSLLVSAELTGEAVERWRELLACDVLQVATDHYALLRTPAIEQVASAVVRTLASGPGAVPTGERSMR